jgi:murein lipoprotein
MSTHISFAVSVLIVLSLTGCASQSQIAQQTNQLQAIEVTLAQIQVNQRQAIELQNTQIALQMQSNSAQAMQMQRQAGSR